MKDWNSKKVVEETLKQLEYERAKIHNKFSRKETNEQALNALINEKFLSLIYTLEDIKGYFVDENKSKELNLAYDELIRLINSPCNYSKEDSIHKNVYALILKVNEFYMFYKNDFRLSYNSVIDLIISKSNSIIQHKSEIINEFERYLKELVELNEIFKKFKLHQKVSIDVFYNYLITLVEEKIFIDFKLFDKFYQNLILNNLEIISKSIIDIENCFNKFKKIQNVSEANLVDFIFETYSTIVLFEEVLGFNNSKNAIVIENNLFEAKFYFKIKNQIWWIKQKITEFNDLKNISNTNDLIRDISRFYFSLKNRKFENIFYGYAFVRGSYYLLDFLVKDLKNNFNNLNLILENNNSVLIFIEEFLQNVELEFKNINISSEVDDDKIKKIIQKYYRELQSNKYQFLNFSFEDPDENLEFTFEEPKVNKKIPPKKNESLFGFDFNDFKEEDPILSDSLDESKNSESEDYEIENSNLVIFNLEDYLERKRTKLLFLKKKIIYIDKNSIEYKNLINKYKSLNLDSTYLMILKNIILKLNKISLDELEKLFKEFKKLKNESKEETALKLRNLNLNEEKIEILGMCLIDLTHSHKLDFQKLLKKKVKKFTERLNKVKKNNFKIRKLN